MMYPYNKYRNKKVTTPDGKFDSKRELKEWEDLKMLALSGEISSLERQKTFQLIPTMKTTAETLRMTTYKADFFYYDNKLKCWVVHDTKGFVTPEYQMKKKLMLWLHPQMVFIESGTHGTKVYKRNDDFM